MKQKQQQISWGFAFKTLSKTVGKQSLNCFMEGTLFSLKLHYSLHSTGE